MEKSYLVTGGIFVILSIILGAFGSHALRPLLPENSFYGYTVAISYLSFQGLGLLILGILQAQTGNLPPAVLYCLLSGTVLFSGSILVLTIGKLYGCSVSFLGPVTPLGGLTLIVGWALLLKHLIQVKF